MKQVNNLKIKYNHHLEKYEVWAPGTVLLEEFDLEEDAIRFAKETKDWLVGESQDNPMNRPPAKCPYCDGQREWTGTRGMAHCGFCGQIAP